MTVPFSIILKAVILLLLLHTQLVEVFATVAQIAHAAIGMQLVEQRQVTVGHQYLLRARRGHGSLTVGGEGKVAGGKHSRLSILDVHVVHTGQVAHTTRNGDITLVLHGASLGTDLHTRIGILRIGVEGHEEYLHALLGHEAREFGELYIVAD